LIARLWSARTPAKNLAAYLHHFTLNVVPELKSFPGFVRVELLTRPADAGIELVVISVWRSFAAIDAFAGPDRESAVVAPSAAALFSSYDRRVRHYEIATANDPLSSSV
jgi:heme-degrading monooxygenase HmoA